MADDTLPGDNDEAISDDLVALTKKQGTDLAWRLYQTRGHNLVNATAKTRQVVHTTFLAPTTLEVAQVISALQNAMQAERAEILGIVNELRLEVNADRKHQVEVGAYTGQHDAQMVALDKVSNMIKLRGAAVWPWSWREDRATTELAIAGGDDINLKAGDKEEEGGGQAGKES